MSAATTPAPWAVRLNLPPELASLPPVVDLATAARLGAGVTSKNTAYKLAREDALPFPVIRVGLKWVVSRHELLKALGYAVTNGATETPGGSAA